MTAHDLIPIIDEDVSRGKDIREAISDAYKLLKEELQLSDWQDCGTKAVLISAWLCSPKGREWLNENRYHQL